MNEADKPAAEPDAAASPSPASTTPEAPAAGTTSPAEAAAPAIELEGGFSYRGQGGVNDGFAEISIAEDGMSALALLYPPVGEGKPLEPDSIRELLAGLGVTSGILWDEIADAVLRCNLDRKPMRDFVVARGSRPEDEVPEHAALEPRFRKNGPVVPDGALRVDYRELSSLAVVKKGEILARTQPRIVGKAGVDVRGRETGFARRSVENVLPGKNCARVEGGIEASVDGLLAINGDRLDVEEILIVKGDVDYHTGHIVFPGDVVIEGRVGDGFKVWSGGSVVCKDTLDAFDVNAKKDLLCAQGIIGRRGGQVRVGGELKSKFVQNCKVAVRGNAHVASAVVGCRFYTLGKLDLGDKGVLMGGELYTVHGLRCGRLGNEAHQRTMVHAGTDFTVQQQLDQANERLRVLAFKAKKAKEASAATPGKGIERLKEALDRSIVELSGIIGRLLLALDADENAQVEVTGDVYPGSVVEICRVSVVVEEPLKACRFRLDKTAGRVIVERLSK
ncbi:MAG: DUF342 domain-containing protein [Spirochaetaceae bacterium]|nr:DUF342 domain-containing protein [Spirochaetaceae bacterium]